LLSCVKSHKTLWDRAEGSFWRDESIKILIAMDLVPSNGENETREYLTRQTSNNRACAVALAGCFDEYILIKAEAGPFGPWLRINLPNRITTAVRELEQKGRNNTKNNRKGANQNGNNRKGPYSHNGKGGYQGNQNNNQNKGAKKGGKKGAKKGKNGGGKKGNNWDNNGWNNNNWGNNWGGNNNWNNGNQNSGSNGNTGAGAGSGNNGAGAAPSG
jgi:hypothetical protein